MQRLTLWSLILSTCLVVPASPAQAPSNDECVNAIFLSAGVNPAVGFFTNTGATNSVGMGDPCQFNNVGMWEDARRFVATL